MKKKYFLIIVLAIIFILSALGIIVYLRYFSPVGGSKIDKVFVVPQNKNDFDYIKSLKEQNIIRNENAFRLLADKLAKDKEIKPGGYRLNQQMNAWQVLSKITGKQDLFWITISFCARREQIGEKLANILGWDDDNLKKWNKVYAESKPEYFEGVYYPDTYLLPSDESGALIAKRFIDHFNEKFAPLADEYVAKNIRWTTGLKIASLIARESGGKEDMKLISGIIWNRLDKGMPLQIDATLQYTHGRNDDGTWWGPIDLAEKKNDSLYNSYLHDGLPPTPICSPDIDAIEAALNPETTNCLYYLHDSNKQIHCAKTYKEHLANIKKYL